MRADPRRCDRAGSRRGFALVLALVTLGGLLGARSALACTGDCNGDGMVTLDEIETGVEIALGAAPNEACIGLAATDDTGMSVTELVAAVGRSLDGCRLQTQALVLTTNFSAGSFATVQLDEAHEVSLSSSQRRVNSDAVVRTRAGLVYVVNRLFADNLQVLDPADAFHTRLQCSTGNGTNPHDIAFAGDDKAYMTLFERHDLLIVNPQAQPDCKDFVRGRIDLGSVADADGIPDMDQMAVVGDRLYVALQHLDINTALRLPAGKGALAVIDIGSDTLLGQIELSGENPFGATKGLTVRNGKIYVAEAGLFNVLDGGIERVDLATGQAEGFFITEADLGGDVTDFVIVSDRLAYAIVSRPGFSVALVAFDPTTAQVTQTVAEADGYTFFDLERNDRGELFLADRNRQHNGVRIYRAADGMPFVAQPIDLGLAPFEIVFLR